MLEKIGVKQMGLAPRGKSEWQVDEATCRTSGQGKTSACATWTDPEFRAGEPAVYYARVVELPTCRWSNEICARTEGAAKPSSCASGGTHQVPKLIRERAWTSPIWYSPR